MRKTARRAPVLPTGISNRIEAESIIVAELAEAIYRERGTESDLGHAAWSEQLARLYIGPSEPFQSRAEHVAYLREIGALCLRWAVAIDLGMAPEPAPEQAPLPF